MKVFITHSGIQFKNPIIGKPTRSVEEHYHGRRINCIVDGEERLFLFDPDEIPFDADEDKMIEAIKKKVIEEKENDES